MQRTCPKTVKNYLAWKPHLPPLSVYTPAVYTARPAFRTCRKCGGTCARCRHVDFACQAAFGAAYRLPARFLKPRRRLDAQARTWSPAAERPGGSDNPAGVQFAEQPFDYPVPDPAVEALVNHVPVAVFLKILIWQT